MKEGWTVALINDDGSIYRYEGKLLKPRVLLTDRRFLETNSGLHHWKLRMLAKALRGTIQTVVKQELGEVVKFWVFLPEGTPETI